MPLQQLAMALERASKLAAHGGSIGLYRKAQNCLRNYLDGIDMKQVKESYEDLFPLPTTVATEEEVAAA